MRPFALLGQQAHPEGAYHEIAQPKFCHRPGEHAEECRGQSNHRDGDQDQAFS